MTDIRQTIRQSAAGPNIVVVRVVSRCAEPQVASHNQSCLSSVKKIKCSNRSL